VIYSTFILFGSVLAMFYSVFEILNLRWSWYLDDQLSRWQMIETVQAWLRLPRNERSAIGQCRQIVAAFHRSSRQHKMSLVRCPVITVMHNCFTVLPTWNARQSQTRFVVSSWRFLGVTKRYVGGGTNAVQSATGPIIEGASPATDVVKLRTPVTLIITSVARSHAHTCTGR